MVVFRVVLVQVEEELGERAFEQVQVGEKRRDASGHDSRIDCDLTRATIANPTYTQGCSRISGSRPVAPRCGHANFGNIKFTHSC